MKTSDLGLATALTTIGHNIISLDKTDPKRVMFVFEDNVSEDEKKYWDGKLQVEPNFYFESMRRIKTRLYN